MSDIEKLDLASENQRLRERVAELEAECLRIMDNVQMVPDAEAAYISGLEARAEKGERERDEARAKQAAMAEHLTAETEALREARRSQALLRTDRDGVWLWQGDGHDDITSLACPVVMSADTLRELLKERERDAARAEAAMLREALTAVRGFCVNKMHAPWLREVHAAIDAAIASTPAPTRAEAEAWLRAGEPVRGALAVPAEPDYSGLCAAPSCEGHCGYVHARGCEAVREYLADHGGDPYCSRGWCPRR